MPSASAAPGMSSTPSMSPINQSCLSGLAGAKPTPQFPITIVVTPCQQLGVSIGSHVTCPSKCVCTSTKPGVTSAPSASIFVWARPATLPTSVMMPSVIATSAVRAGAPVPSTTVPPLITRSCIGSPFRELGEERLHILHEEVWLFERGEVSAPVEAGVPDQVEPRGGVCLRDPEDLLREHGCRGRDLDEVVARAEVPTALRLAVQADRRVDRLRDPVDREVREDLLAGHGILGVAVVVGPVPELLDNPARESRRRVGEAVAERLRVLSLNLLVCRATSHELARRREISSL